jgi:transposase
VEKPMAKYKVYNYDQMVMIPISLEDQLEPGTLEYTINELVEKNIDLTVFEGRYQNDETGATAINPKVLIKVILFAYSRGMISSRQIERACGENILFMALSCGYRPDHSTIAHFVSSMQKEIESIFSNILLVCAELDLLGGTHFSLDGVKLSSNASKEWSGTFKELEKKRDKLQGKLRQVIAEHIHEDGLARPQTEKHQKQIKRLQHQVERLSEFLQEQKPKVGKGRQEIQSNVTDNQSAKMPTSHGVLQGYNAQALVDAKHQIIMHAEAFASQDHENLAPMMSGAKKNMQAVGKDENYFEGKQVTADSNYHSYASLALCKAEGLDAYIPDIQFRKRDERFAQQQRFKEGIHPRQRVTKQENKKEGFFTIADFFFDKSKRAYICPHGKVLSCNAHGHRIRHRVYDIYRARQEDCASCPLRLKCLSKPHMLRKYLVIPPESQPATLVDEMKAKIDSPQGRLIYARRLAIVEPVFANIRIQKRLDHFTLRTKSKVDVQWKLFTLVHNIGKIHKYGRGN